MHGAQKNSKQKSTFFMEKAQNQGRQSPGWKEVCLRQVVFKRTEVTVIKFQVAIIPERWGAPTPTRAEKTLGVLFPAGLYFGGARF